jgi:hypothetical protein
VTINEEMEEAIVTITCDRTDADIYLTRDNTPVVYQVSQLYTSDVVIHGRGAYFLSAKAFKVSGNFLLGLANMLKISLGC